MGCQPRQAPVLVGPPSPHGTPGSSSAETNDPPLPPPVVFGTFFSSKVLCPGPGRPLPHPGLFSQPDYLCKAPGSRLRLEHRNKCSGRGLLVRRPASTLRHSVICHIHGLQPARPLRPGILQAGVLERAATLPRGNLPAPGLNPESPGSCTRRWALYHYCQLGIPEGMSLP